MPVNLSIKNVPDALAARLRARARRSHRSLQGELMALLAEAVDRPSEAEARSPVGAYQAEQSPAGAAGLYDRVQAIIGAKGVVASKRLTREQAHDRKLLRKLGI